MKQEEERFKMLVDDMVVDVSCILYILQFSFAFEFRKISFDGDRVTTGFLKHLLLDVLRVLINQGCESQPGCTGIGHFGWCFSCATSTGDGQTDQASTTFRWYFLHATDVREFYFK